MCFLPGFGDHAFITSQNIDGRWFKQILPKEQPEDGSPGNDCVEEALHGAVTSPIFDPAGNAQHGYPTRHCQQSRNNQAKLSYGCFVQTRTQTL